jgi:transposase
MTKTTRARYTLDFKPEAVPLVEGGQSQAAVAKTLGLVEQTSSPGDLGQALRPCQ